MLVAFYTELGVKELATVFLTSYLARVLISPLSGLETWTPLGRYYYSPWVRVGFAVKAEDGLTRQV